MATRNMKSAGFRQTNRRKQSPLAVAGASDTENQATFAPPGSVVVMGTALPAGAPFGFAPPSNVTLGFAPPANVPLGFAPPSPVILGFVGPGGVILGLAQHPAAISADAMEPARVRKGDAKSVLSWRDDPGSAAIVKRPVPNPSRAPLAFKFSGAAPAPGHYRHGTAEFRFWVAAEALRRGADFWASIVRSIKWHTGKMLPVELDAGADFNAYYDREALRFFHGPTPFGTVYSGESPDILCHEMGHAILDAIKPQLWGAASHEAAAFHESFGDMSALLSALQLDDMRNAVLHETGGRFYASSSLSRLAEQLGAAIRLAHPQDVESDCLRNAVNSFTYLDPINLPPIAPASQLSSEPHSFSRVFTGAFFEAMAGLLALTAARHGAPTSRELRAVAELSANLLVTAIVRAPVVSNFYAQVAAEMVRAAAEGDEKHAGVLRNVFIRRSILSLRSATTVGHLHLASRARAAGPRDGDPGPALGIVAIDASRYGIDRPLAVESPSHARQFAVSSSAPDASSIEPSSAITAARSFADDIIRRGRVDLTDAGGAKPKLHTGRRFHTHELVSDNGSVRLARRRFDCGLRRD